MNLSALQIGSAQLEPGFDPEVYEYTASYTSTTPGEKAIFSASIMDPGNTNAWSCMIDKTDIDPDIPKQSWGSVDDVSGFANEFEWGNQSGPIRFKVSVYSYSPRGAFRVYNVLVNYTYEGAGS